MGHLSDVTQRASPAWTSSLLHVDISSLDKDLSVLANGKVVGPSANRSVSNNDLEEHHPMLEELETFPDGKRHDPTKATMFIDQSLGFTKTGNNLGLNIACC